MALDADSRIETLLPMNATQLEVDLLEAFIEEMDNYLLDTFGDIKEIGVRYLYNPTLCIAAALPHLACALSVDVDISVFTETQQRSLIRESFKVHLEKGTVGSIRDIIEALGWSVASDGIIEGRRAADDSIIRSDGGWAQFTVSIGNVIPREQAQAVFALVQSIAPVSRKLVEFDFSSVAKFYDGDPDSEGRSQFIYDGTFTYGSVLTDETLSG